MLVSSTCCQHRWVRTLRTSFSIYLNMRRKLQFGLIIKMSLKKLSFVWWMLLKRSCHLQNKVRQPVLATQEIDNKRKTVNNKDIKNRLYEWGEWEKNQCSWTAPTIFKNLRLKGVFFLHKFFLLWGFSYLYVHPVWQSWHVTSALVDLVGEVWLAQVVWANRGKNRKHVV